MAAAASDRMPNIELRHVLAALCSLALLYLALLHRQLRKKHPDARSRPLPSDDELWRISEYTHIEARELDGLPSLSDPQYGVCVIGGSGLLGRALCRLLLRRGHRYVRLIDIVEPPEDLLANPHCTFMRVDLRDREAVRQALHQPLDELKQPPRVVHCPATALRFWERSKATRRLTMDVNVTGIQNVVAAMQSSPAKSKVLVYTSSVAVSVKAPLYCRLGWFDRSDPKWSNPMHHDDDDELPIELLGGGHYSVSKVIGEQYVLAANGKDDLRTTALRPGMAVIGPTDRFVSIYLKAVITPTFLDQYCQSATNARDLARAHLMMADTLLDDKRYKKVAGDHFLLTSQPGWDGAWDFRSVRHMTQLFAGRKLFIAMPEILAYVMAHGIELLCAISGWLGYTTPAWLGDSVYLQPATFEPCVDVAVDDSRLRKTIGYKHLWTTPQSVRYIVDEVAKELAQLKAEGKPQRRHESRNGPASAIADVKHE